MTALLVTRVRNPDRANQMRAACSDFAEALGVRTRPRVAFESSFSARHDYSIQKAMRRRIALPKHFVRNNGRATCSNRYHRCQLQYLV
jgi:hypothetical protein